MLLNSHLLMVIICHLCLLLYNYQNLCDDKPYLTNLIKGYYNLHVGGAVFFFPLKH